MSQENATELLKKYADGQATAQEKALIERWYLDQHEVSAQADLIDLEVERLRSISGFKKHIKPPVYNNRGYQIIAAAASLILIIGIGFYLYVANINKGRTGVSLAAESVYHDILPGANGATLTLANGQVLKLSDTLNQELAEGITKTADGQLIYSTTARNSLRDNAKHPYHTLSTAKGEQYRVVLPDRTVVWLNASSSLTYPTSFDGAKKREVILTGEAYFEVTKSISDRQGGIPLDAKQRQSAQRIPFIVSTRYQSIEVMGTHFNISSYEDDLHTETTLLEGSVRVIPAFGLKGRLLIPGQQAVLSADHLQVITVDTEQETAWKNGQFYFKNSQLKDVMRQISRWYNVQVSYDQKVPKHILLGGWISRSKKLSAVLNLIELTGQAHFKVEGRRIMVMP